MPLAALMASRGRRAGLVLAYLLGALGAVVVVVGAAVENFPLLLLGLVGFGAGSSANLAARFAAADLAEPDHRARAISTVVWATTIGAVLGPNIAAPAGESVSGLGIPATAGPFVWAAGVFVLSAAVVAVLLLPDPLLTARALADPGSAEEPGGPLPSRGDASGTGVAQGPARPGHRRRLAHRDGLDHVDDPGRADPPRRGHPADRSRDQRAHRGHVRLLARDGLAVRLAGLAVGDQARRRADRRGGADRGHGGAEPRPDGPGALRPRPRLVRRPGVRLGAAHRLGAAGRAGGRPGALRLRDQHGRRPRRARGGPDRLAGGLRAAQRDRRVPAAADGGARGPRALWKA
ncbi:hypothetical protein SNARM312S_08337 [Streptomyces narbonensis]